MPEPKLDEKFYSRLREQFAADEAAETHIRAEARLDLRFLAGGEGQWAPEVLAIRKAANRPCLTFSRLHVFVAQVANEARQQKMAAKVRPVDAVADPNTAKVYSGLMRHIHLFSEGDVAKETAIQYSAACGIGYLGLKSEYCDYETTDQEILERTFPDPFAVYGILIPTCLGQKPDHSFVIEQIPRAQYERLYGPVEQEWEGGSAGGWISEKYVRIAEYRWIDYETVEVEGRGKVRKPRVHSVLTNGYAELGDTYTRLPGEEIPIWASLGEVTIVDGVPHIASVIRHARDPQQLVNFYKSNIAEAVGLAPRAPFVGPLGSFKTRANDWTRANTESFAFLEYDPVQMPNGSYAPAPQRQIAEVPIQALSAAAAQEIDDLKGTTNIHDASLGAAGNETSGRAIQARQAQSGLSNFHYLDNLARADKRKARCTIRWIPEIYDTPRTLRIIGDDNKEAVVLANQAGGFDLTAGKYDLAVDEGPAFATEQQEKVQTLKDTVQYMGPQGIVLVPTMLRAMGENEAAEQVEKTLPPELRKNAGQQQIDPQMFAQMAQQHAQLTQVVQQQADVIENKRVEAESLAQLDREKMANDRYIAELNGKIAIIKQQMTLQSAESRAEASNALKELQIQLDALNEKFNAAHETRMKLMDQAHEAGMAAAEMTHDSIKTGAQHEHDSEMADRQAAAKPEPKGE